jgi:hypothetical protein
VLDEFRFELLPICHGDSFHRETLQSAPLSFTDHELRS